MKTRGTMAADSLQESNSSRRAAKSFIFLVTSFLFGGASLLLWVTFLSRGALGVVDLGFGPVATLFFDGALSLVFFIQHSAMVRPFFKRRMGRWIRHEYHGAVYAIASGVVLSGLALFWQGPVWRLVALGDVGSFVVQVMSFAALVGFIWGVRSLGGFDMFGSGSIIRLLRGREFSTSGPLTIRGPYRFIRHPLYLFCLIAIWSVPVITVDRLLYNIMWTGWIIVGSMLEERDLLAVFGDGYRVYRTKVPMLIPWRRPIQPTLRPSLAGGPDVGRAQTAARARTST
jgi:methanethiol S-methyltransferase